MAREHPELKTPGIRRNVTRYPEPMEIANVAFGFREKYISGVSCLN